MADIFKLIDGTEIISDVSDDSELSVTVEQPYTINYKYRTDAFFPSVALTRFMPFSKDGKVILNKKLIVSQSMPLSGLELYYKSLKKIVETENHDEILESEFIQAASVNSTPEVSELSDDLLVKMAMMEKNVLKTPLN